MPLKRHYPDVRFGANQVTPDEIDRYEQYQVINPAISTTFFGSATAGTVSQAVTVGLGNTVADYPRSVALVFTGSASVSGTATVTGKNQFGVSQSETLALAQGTQTAGVVDGTLVFAEISACSVAMGTGVSGTGTVSLGVGTTEGKVKFGLPAKLGGVADVKAITWTTESGIPTVLNGGTVASTDYVDTTNHAFLGSAALEGTTTYSVLFKPSYSADKVAPMANL